MSKYLFEEFNSVSEAEWKQKIQFDLKGADYNDTLLWKTNEDIVVKPFYHSEQQIENAIANNNTPFVICDTIIVTEAVEANKKALEALEKGAESLRFILENKDINTEFLLKGIQHITLFLEASFLDHNFVQSIRKIATQQDLTINFNIDIIGHLAKTGNWFYNLEEDHTILEKILAEPSTNERVLGVHANIYQNAGATAVQQIAYALAHANEYLNHFGENAANQLQFNFAIGSNYFFEIAKLRAFKLCFQSLIKEYTSTETNCAIFAEPSKRNKTLYDYNVNMLRTTTECMSAILGGAQHVTNLPYDALYHHSNEFGDRISRNQLLVLKAESYFDKVINPAEGSYYIESLTKQLAEKALDIFKQIENGGGFLKQLKEGVIQRKIKESAQKEQALFDSGELVLLGTNKHPNELDKMKGDLELNPFLKKEVRKTLLEPILEKRLSEAYEQNRLENE